MREEGEGGGGGWWRGGEGIFPARFRKSSRRESFSSVIFFCLQILPPRP